jgi:3-isopropylmalate/(R)-2-methylmalate dehydratase small subunit
VAGENFGCGSSREMAVWALADYGIRCVVAPSFGGIFFDNCFQGGVLPLVLPGAEVERLAAAVEAATDHTVSVDLETCLLTDPGGRTIPFEVNALRRRALLEGLDPIAATLSLADDIERFQRADRTRRPWVWLPGREATDAGE